MSLNFPENPPSLAFAPSVTGRPRSSLPSLSSVRPVSPVRLEPLDKGKSKKVKNACRPRSAIPSPSRDQFALSTRQMAPFPPSCPKPTKTSKKRNHVVSTSHIQPRRSPEPGGPYLLAVVGKPVGVQAQFEEKSNQDLVEEKELTFKSKIPKHRHSQDGSKLSPTRSFEELSKGSKIPVLSTSSSKTSKSKTSSPSQSRCPSQTEVVQDAIVLTTYSSDTTINDDPIFIEDHENKESFQPVTVVIKKKCASESSLVSDEKVENNSVPDANKQKPVSARPVMDMGKVDINAHYKRDIVLAIDKATKALGKHYYRSEGVEAPGRLRELLPSKPNPERLISSSLQDKPARDHHHRKCGELIDEIALNSVVKEFKKIHEMLFQMKRKYAIRTDRGGDIFMSNFYSADSNSGSCILVLKNLTSEMYKMVSEVDNGIACVQKSAQSIVTDLQENFTKTKENLLSSVEAKESEVKQLEQNILELEYSIKEKDSSFASLEALVDNMNEENEKFANQCREMEITNEKLISENEKANLELTFRVRELNNLRCDIQRRDICASQILDQYNDVWKERNSLNVQLALLQSDLSVAESRRLNLQTENNELREQLDYLIRQIGGVDGDLPDFKDLINKQDNGLASGDPNPESSDEIVGIRATESLMHLKTAATEPDGAILEQDDNTDHISFIDGTEVFNPSQENVMQVKDNAEQQPQKEDEKPQEVEKEKRQDSKEDISAGPIEDQDVFVVPQEIADRIMNLEFAIQERNIQMKEFQEIISSLKERNGTLEKEKRDEMNKHAGFRQETLEEAQHLRDIYARLQDKEKHLDDLINQNTPQNSESSNGNSNDDGVDWFEECVKASKRLQNLEECMLRQDGLFKEIEAEKEYLSVEVNKLKQLMSEYEKPDPVSFEGIQELLKDIQCVVNKLYTEDTPAKKSPKAIRFYPDAELAVKELQSMKKTKTTAVFIVANAFSTAKDLLYKRIGKKKGRKHRRKLKIKNLVDSTGNDRSIDHISEEGISTYLTETQDESKHVPDESRCVEESQKDAEMGVSLDASNCEDSASVDIVIEEAPTSTAGGKEEQSDEAIEEPSDILDFSNAENQDVTESPRLSQSINELKSVDVDSLRNVLQRGRSVNTLALKSSSLLLCYRQQLSPVSENEESRGEVKQECQLEEENTSSE